MRMHLILEIEISNRETRIKYACMLRGNDLLYLFLHANSEQKVLEYIKQ